MANTRRTPPPAPPRDDAPPGCVCSGCCCSRGGAHCRDRGCAPCTDPTTTAEYWPYASGAPHGSGLLCLGCVYSSDPHYHSPSYWGLDREATR